MLLSSPSRLAEDLGALAPFHFGVLVFKSLCCLDPDAGFKGQIYKARRLKHGR